MLRRRLLYLCTGVLTVALGWWYHDSVSSGYDPAPNETHTHDPEADDLSVDIDLETRIEETTEQAYVVFETKNNLGRPLHELDVDAEIRDADDVILGTVSMSAYGLRHDDRIRLVSPWFTDDETLESAASIRASPDFVYGDPAIPTATPDECDDSEDWQCDGTLTIPEFDVDVDRSGQHPTATVSGFVEAVGEAADGYYVVARSISDGTVIASGITDSELGPPSGERAAFSIEIDLGPLEGGVDAVQVALSKPVEDIL